ncbi:MAG: UDP-N-acetylmuramate--L-alanine ligase, partial [Nannocystaceae bacterium]
MFRKRDTHIHFVGIGGIGMSGIAEVLANLGYRVTGSDLATTDTTNRLAGLGASIYHSHEAQHVDGADVVVTSSAIQSENPEVAEALARKIPVIPRAEMLAELMRLKQGVLIAGSHGKTTTTSILATMFHHAGLDPTVVIGGKVNSFDSNARLGYGEFLVAEADESDGSFLVLPPTFAVITNIDDEHLDHYGDLATLLDAFVGFANRVPFYGATIVCTDDPNVRTILPRSGKRTVTYGLDGTPDYLATAITDDGEGSRFEVTARGESMGAFNIQMPGLHNVRNALAAIALCDSMSVHPASVRAALEQFDGVQRRFTVRASCNGITIVDDYAHHPTEIRATLSGARARFPKGRIFAIVQPHRYTRVRDSLDRFPESLDAADEVMITDIYAAGEAPIEGIHGQLLVEQVRARRPDRPVSLTPSLEAIPASLLPRLQAGDVVVTMGAGSITKLSHW